MLDVIYAFLLLNSSSQMASENVEDKKETEATEPCLQANQDGKEAAASSPLL